MPERVLYLEPVRRRMSVELGGNVVVRSDDATLLFEPARYPVAYFPIADIADGVLQPSDHEGAHPDLGETRWFDVAGGDGKIARRSAWQHVDPPAQAAAVREKVAFAWCAMDAFYEERGLTVLRTGRTFPQTTATLAGGTLRRIHEPTRQAHEARRCVRTRVSCGGARGRLVPVAC
jgi:uncharacterized protein (DUF427 family)